MKNWDCISPFLAIQSPRWYVLTVAMSMSLSRSCDVKPFKIPTDSRQAICCARRKTCAPLTRWLKLSRSMDQSTESSLATTVSGRAEVWSSANKPRYWPGASYLQTFDPGSCWPGSSLKQSSCPCSRTYRAGSLLETTWPSRQTSCSRQKVCGPLKASMISFKRSGGTAERRGQVDNDDLMRSHTKSLFPQKGRIQSGAATHASS
mmetsp:Transcript_14089/g.29481  ORF Transcript_14089/g.29481 Transcript_14089/m.29481 type:complete len:205 (+) Transcript_14089:1271-1885(+)